MSAQTRSEAGSAAAAAAGPAELAARAQYRRAVEATIWGMPAVAMAAIRRSLRRDLDADYGDIIYFSQVMAPRHEFLTANHETPYVFVFFDLKAGPMVLEVPPASDTVALFGSGIDSWEVPLIDVGPAGEDAGRGGRYLFLPPGYGGEPPGGFIVVPSPTYYVHFALRPIASGTGTQADAVAYSQHLRSYPLEAAANPPPNRYIDAYPLAWKTLPTYDVDYLRLLAEVIDVEPPQAKDGVMLGMLSSLGIAKDTPFAPDGARAALLARAVRDGEGHMRDYFINHAFVPHWPSRHWLTFKPDDTHGFSYYGDGTLDYDRRAGMFYWGTWAPKRGGDPSKLPASYYLMAFRDAEGALYRGDRLYRLRVPADTPARDFWSIIAYEIGTNAFIHNPQDRVGVSSYDRGTLAANADGSVDVYIGPGAPAGFAANWIPTAGKDFWLVGRYYGPQLPLFDKSWIANDVEKVG